jgi:uncharacterized protein (TIGR03437 family)
MPIVRLGASAALCLVAASLACGQPAVTTVVNGASFEPGVAPGSLVVIYGKGLAGASVSSPVLPLPTSLAGSSVQINGIAAALHYVSDTQINAVVPLETPAGGAAPVVVTAAGGSSQPYRMKVDPCAPAVFTRVGNGTGRAIVFSASYQLLDQVQPGQVISFYATGLGATAAGPDGYTRAVVTPSLFIGESAANVVYAGPSGYPGVYQMNAVVPESLASERFYLACAPSPFSSNMAEIGIPAGQNTAEESGEIQALYPRNGSAVSFSPLLTAAKFKAQFTVAAGAKPFPVAAVGDGGGIVFLVDPASGRITGKSRTATPAERAGDFSQSSRLSVIDFVGGGLPMPGGIVPASRLDPAAVAALRAVPTPNAGSGDANFVYEGKTSASGPTVLDDAAGVNVFGSFFSIPYAPWLTSRSAAFKLYIDGKLVAADKVTYALPVPPPAVVVALKEVVLASATVAGGSPVQGTVTLTAAAPTGGAAVALSSGNAAATAPASVTVAAGQTSAAFTVSTRNVLADVNVVITARLGSDSRTAGLAIKPAGIAGPFGMLFVSVPAGEFMMGCSPGDSQCTDNEKPRHLVKIAKSFEMGKYEVTQSQWKAVMGASPAWVRDPNDPNNGDRPVQQVSWNDAQEFLAALTARRDGYRYRLPTEAEWEYAARAGSTDIHPGGTTEEIACIDWYNTCVVGQFKPNAWGLYDMIGNVREYCSDWMHEKYYETSPADDPQGPATQPYTDPIKVNRGGAWGVTGQGFLRASARAASRIDNRNLLYGFRVVRQRGN